MKQETRKNLVTFVKFTAFSISAGVIEFGTFTLLNELTSLDPWISSMIGLVLSVLWNFTINRKFTFKSANNIPLAMTLVFVFYLFFTPYQIVFTNLFTRNPDIKIFKPIREFNAYLVLFIIMVQNFILEYLWCRFIIYRKSIDTRKKKN